MSTRNLKCPVCKEEAEILLKAGQTAYRCPACSNLVRAVDAPNKPAKKEEVQKKAEEPKQDLAMDLNKDGKVDQADVEIVKKEASKPKKSRSRKKKS